MLIALAALVLAVIVLVFVLLAVVVAGIHAEPPQEELSSRAPNLIAAAARRLIGVYVSKPTSAHRDAEAHLAGHTIGCNKDGESR